MPRVNVLTHSFNGGEISRAALNRVDQERFRLNAERQENLFPYVVGKAIMRPGTRYISQTVSGLSRAIPFAKSLDTRALLELGYVGTQGKLRVFIDDELVTRPEVTSSVTTSNFSSSTGWTSVLTGGATSNFGAVDGLILNAVNKGSSAIVKQQVSTSSAGTQHALRIEVTRGSVLFRCGSTDGDDDYISETTLRRGVHSLAFIPSGSYWVWFKSEVPRNVVVRSCEVEDDGPMAVDAPWVQADLRTIRYAQSLDVVFLTIKDRQQMMIERRGNNSWSVVYYETDDGPFRIARSANVKITPSATRGNITLTSSSDFFDAAKHERSLFRLTHENVNATVTLAAVGEHTAPIRVIGLKTGSYNDRDFTVTTSGTWSGSIQIQRSFDSEFSGFEDFGSAITTNTATTSGDDDDNAIIYYRVIVKTLASGAVTVNVSYDHDGGTGICRVIAVTGATTATAEVLSDFTDVDATDVWLEGDWGLNRGYPTALSFFDGRLFFARDDRFWGSISDGYFSFSLDVEGDSGSIQRDVSTGNEFSEINWVLPLQRLIFGTSGAEISARTSAFDEPLTPTNITLKPASTQGAANVTPVRIDSRGVFVQRSGQEIYELLYDVESNDYSSRNLMRLNEDAAFSSNPDLYEDKIVELAVQRQPETYVWALRDDGVCLVLLYEPAEEVRGWFKMISGNEGALDADRPSDRIISVTVLPGEEEDDVYFVVERTASDAEGGSAEFYYIEKLGKHSETLTRTYNTTTQEVEVKNGLYMADSYITATGDGTAGQVVSGLDHLIETDVIVIGQVVGGDFGPVTDSNGDVEIYSSNNAGEITLSQKMTGTLCIGRPYSGLYKSSKLAFAAQEGSALLQKKIVDQVGLALLDTHMDGILIGPDFEEDNMSVIPRIDDDGNIVDAGDNFLRSLDDSTFPFDGQWDTDSRVCIKIRPGHSATLSALVTGVETKEKP